MTQSLTDRYDDRIAGVLSCYDRMVITGTLPGVCYADGMTRYLNAKGIRVFDYPQFAMELRDRLRDCAASLAAGAGVTIEHIAKNQIRKEAVVARVLERRGDRPGLVHIISAMEACDSYRPWHDKGTGRTFVRPDSGKCLHYSHESPHSHTTPKVSANTGSSASMAVYCSISGNSRASGMLGIRS